MTDAVLGRQHALERRLDQVDFGRQAGVHGALEGLAEVQLEVAAQVDEVAEVEAQVGEVDVPNRFRLKSRSSPIDRWKLLMK